MAIVAWPTGISLAEVQWQQPPVEQVNRSPWSNRTRIVQFGAAARWSAEGDLPPMKEAKRRRWLAFVMQLRGRTNVFGYPVGEVDQHALTISAPGVDTASADYVLRVKGLPAATHILDAGHFVTVMLPSGDRQLVGLTTAMDSDSGGRATVLLATALRETPAADAGIELKRPYGWMRAVNPLAWTVEPSPVYAHSLQMEEAF